MSVISDLEVKIGADSSGLSKELAKSQAEIKQTFNVNPINEMSNAVNDLTGSIAGISSKIGGMVELFATGFGLTSLVQDAVDAGASVYQLSQRLHASNAEALEFSRVLQLTGGDTQTAQTAFLRLDKSLMSSGESGKKCRATLAAVGVTLTDQNGKLLPVNEQLGKLAEGYQKAASAGHSQEFLMNTLGARGLSLVKTLQEYNEAKANAAKVQGIGIDPEEMHKMQQDMRTLQLQAGQLKIAFGSMLVGIFGGNLNNVNGELASMAKYIADNRQQIADTTATVLKLVTAYEAVKVAKRLATNVSETYGNVKDMFSVKNDVNTANDAALTASQEKRIAEEQRLVANLAKKEENAYLKTVQAMEVSEAEKTRIYTEYLIKREQASAASQAAILANMTEMYEQQNAAAQASAETQTAAINTVTEAAENAAARETEANSLAADSANVVANANVRLADSLAMTADAARVSADQMVAGNEEVLASTSAATDAYLELGVGAEEAGAKSTLAAETSTAAQEKSTLATEASTLEQGKLALATEAAGVEAEVTGTKTVAASFSAMNGVKNLTAAVWALAGGWMGVAVAAAIALKAAYDYFDGLNRIKGYNKNADVFYKDGKYYKRVIDDNPVSSNGTTQSASLFNQFKTGNFSDDPNTEIGSGLGEKVVELSPEEYEAQYAYDAKKAKDKERMDAIENGDYSFLDKGAEDILSAIGKPSFGGGSSGGGGGSHAAAARAAVPQTYDVQEAVGDLAATIAAAHPDGEQFMGNITDNPAIQCDSFTANVYSNAGVASIGGYDTSSNVINDSAFKSAGAYHPVGDGYTPQNGDLVDFEGHVGIYDNGNVISRQSSAGVHTASMSEAESYFGPVQGYGSIAEATGNMTVTAKVDASSKQMIEAAQKLQKAKEEASKLFNTMSNSINDEVGTDYEKGMRKLTNDVTAKKQEISKLSNAGVDTTALSKELDVYDQVMQQKVVDAWRKSWSELKEDTAKALADVTNNYKAAADTQYETTVRKLDDERIERRQAVAQDKDDKVAMAAVEAWYNAQVSEAIKKYSEELRDAHDKRMKALEDEGNYQGLLLEMQNGKSKDNQQSLDFKGQQALAKEYHKLIDDMQRSTYQDLSDSASSFYSTMTSSMSDFITGTHGAMEVVKSFEKAVLNAIANIVAQRAAAQLTGSLLGAVGSAILPGIGGGGTALNNYLPSGHIDVGAAPDITAGGSVFGSDNYGFNAVMPQVKLAAGGIVSSPTVALIGEEPGVSEAVVPLKNGVLGAGNVEVNITNNTNDNVSLQSSHYDDGAQKMILNFVVDGVQRNVNNSANSLKSLLGGG